MLKFVLKRDVKGKLFVSKQNLKLRKKVSTYKYDECNH